MPRRRRPKPEIIEYKQLKAASGGGGGRGPTGGGGGGFRPGESLVCKVICDEPGGYAVWITKYNHAGFLPTQALLHSGEEIIAQFVCVHNHRILVTARFSNNVRQLPVPQNMSGEEHSDVDDLKITASSHEIESMTEKTLNFRPYKMKRSSDLIMPPVIDDSIINTEGFDLDWLINELEGGQKTGCVKASRDEGHSRSAMLLHHGRVVGCMFSSNVMPETDTTKESLKTMLIDLAIPGIKVQIYDLPENIVSAMSSLFLGRPVMRNDNYDARAYFDYISVWFEREKSTACIAISLKTSSSTCLAFVHNGQFCGAFNVEDVQFSLEKEDVYDLLRKDSQANIEASILIESERSGYSLSAVRAQVKWP